MIYDSLAHCIGSTPMVYLKKLFPGNNITIAAKLELLNPGGSIKDRPAKYIIEEGIANGTITPTTHIIESSSGNFGIAIAILARIYNLQFTCVVDPKIASTNLLILNKLKANIEMVSEFDDQGGYLQTRIKRIQELLLTTPNSYWPNQYANEMNWKSHYNTIGKEILDDFNGNKIDCLVASVSTTGTILGISRRLRENFPDLRVVAVDAVGSVIFGGPAGPRSLPGIGSSRVPELLRTEEIDEVVHVTDTESIQGCYDLLNSEGIFAGGSSGSVVAALGKLVNSFPANYSVITIFPDRGERYIDSVYEGCE